MGGPTTPSSQYTSSVLVLRDRNAGTGCLMCKKRRLLCDLQWPSCGQCLARGYRCDATSQRQKLAARAPFRPQERRGPLQRHSRSHSDVQNPLSSSFNLIPQTADEALHANNFWIRSYYTIFFPSQFGAISSIVKRLSVVEPTFRHMVAALGCLHCAHLDTDGQPSHDRKQFALEQYTKALKSLQFAASTNNWLVVLTASVQMILQEVMRGHENHFRMHLSNAVEIVQRLKAENHPIIKYSHFATMEQILTRAFAHSASFPGHGDSLVLPIVDHDALDTVGPPSFHSYQEAVGPFMTLLNAAVVHLRLTESFNLANPEEHLRRLMFHLEEWIDAFHRFMESSPPVDLSSSRESALLSSVPPNPLETKVRSVTLLSNAYITYLRLVLANAPDEMAWDHWNSRMASLLAMLDPVVHKFEKRGWCVDFSGDVAELQPLWYVAVKCRHPAIRRQALELLRRSRNRHGWWSGIPLYHTAKRVIELEEKGLVVRKSSDVPVPARFRLVEMDAHSAERYVRVKYYRKSRTGSDEWEETLAW